MRITLLTDEAVKQDMQLTEYAEFYCDDDDEQEAEFGLDPLLILIRREEQGDTSS